MMFFLIQRKITYRDRMHSWSVLYFFYIKENNLDVDLEGNGKFNEKNSNAILKL